MVRGPAAGPGTGPVHFVDDFLHGDLLKYTKQTVWEALAGCGMGLGVALPLGYLIARSDLAASALQPYLAASQAVPAVALAPLFALWFGYGLLPFAMLCALLVFFPILVNTVLGLRSPVSSNVTTASNTCWSDSEHSRSHTWARGASETTPSRMPRLVSSSSVIWTCG